MNSEQIVADRYISILEGQDVKPAQDDTRPFDNSHLLWMLYEIKNNNLSSRTKANRWLGYVQGVLCFKNVISVNTERAETRDIFNGE